MLYPTFSPAVVRNVTVTTANATALLVSWNALQDSYLSHYTIYYSAFSPLLSKVVDQFKKEIPSISTSEIVNIRELRAGVEHQFQVTAPLELDGRVFKREKSVPAIRVFGKAPSSCTCGCIPIASLPQVGSSSVFCLHR